MNNHNLPAFPIDAKSWQERVGKGLSQSEVDKIVFGVSKREYFAAMAMQGILSGSTDNHALVQGGDFNTPHIALKAVQLAEELLKQLETK